MGKLDEKVAIITGGGTGIGHSIALTFANSGADIVVCGRTIANLEKVTEEIKALGRRSLAVATDVSVKEQVQNLVSQAVDEFGKIDILVNNAGVIRDATLLEMTEEDWDYVVDINLKGVFLCIQAVAKYMVERRYGKIINISSICGRGGSLEDKACYCASKAGVIQLTKNAAYELGEYGIGVNCVAPGLIITPMVHRGRSPEQLEQLIDDRKRVAVVGRVGDPQDIANVALFLASEDSSFINGQTVPVDGGRIDRM